MIQNEMLTNNIPIPFIAAFTGLSFGPGSESGLAIVWSFFSFKNRINTRLYAIPIIPNQWNVVSQL